MSKKRWFRFHIERWRQGTFRMPPNERVVYLEMLCELYDKDGFARLDNSIMAARCGLRPTSFQKALDTLVAKGKLDIQKGYFTNKAVTEEIISREKLAQKSTESRQKKSENVNENKPTNEKDTPYTEYRKQNSNIEDIGEYSERLRRSVLIKGLRNGR